MRRQIILVQSIFHRKVAMTYLSCHKKAATDISAAWRRVVKKRSKFEQTKAAVTKISAAWRCHRSQTLFKVTIASKPIMHAFVLD